MLSGLAGKLRIFGRFRRAGATAQPPRGHEKSRLRAFHREDGGLAALEFALILPALITMLFGMGELSLAVFCRTAVSQIAGTVADLVAQESTVSAADLKNVYYAANIILYPYYPNFSATPPAIRVTSVIYDSTAGDPTKTGKVAWTCTQTGNGALPTPTPVKNGAYTFTQSLLTVGGSVVMAEVAFNYASPTTRTMVASLPMSNSFYTKPRRVAQIPPPASCS